MYRCLRMKPFRTFCGLFVVFSAICLIDVPGWTFRSTENTVDAGVTQESRDVVKLDTHFRKVVPQHIQHIVGDTNISVKTSEHTESNEMSQENSIRRRFVGRQSLLQNKCSKLKENISYHWCEENGVKNNLKYVNQSEIIYCAIEKTGSTFWKRILHIAGDWGNVSNPTHMGIGKAYVEKGGYRSMSKNNWAEIKYAFQHSRSFMFVRDPYTRLFSGWLDKLYSPNTYYWNSTGRHILKTQRRTFDPMKGECAFDVTFSEFVNHTMNEILSKQCIDGHFQPNYRHCLPCNLTFDYIGKYETIKEDTMFLLNTFNLSEKVKFQDFEGDAALDAIRDGSDWVFSQKKTVLACGVPFSCALFRVWSRLQSRGILSKEMNFPYNTKEECSNVTRKQFESILIDANKKSLTENLQNNRKEALTQALLNLPKEVINKVHQAFEVDFDLFGYDRISRETAEPSSKSTFKYFQSCPSELR